MFRSLPVAATTLVAFACVIVLAGGMGRALAQDLVITEELKRAAFRAADRNGDMMLDEAEIAADATAAFLALDRNGDGVVERAELVGADAGAFGRVDVDGNGLVTYDELRLAKLADFNAADRTQNGQLTMAELLDYRPEAK